MDDIISHFRIKRPGDPDISMPICQQKGPKMAQNRVKTG
jgi:hypothetical protein